MNTTKSHFIFTIVGVLAVFFLAVTLLAFTTSAAETNIIPNADLNQASAGLPTNWQNGKWGTNTTTFTYPATSADGTAAAKVAMTAYTSGDAKWFFTPVTVTANTSYHFKSVYSSNVTTSLIAQFTSTTGTVTYTDLASIPVSTGWSTIDKTFTTPANTSKVTIFHVLNKVGTLSVDNYFLSPTDTGGTPSAPTVTLTSPANGSIVSGTIALSANATGSSTISGVKFLVDGSLVGTEDTTSPYSVSYNTTSATNGSHTIAAVARDSAGKTATSTISVTVNNTITPPATTTGNMILNPSVETANGSVPTNWQNGKWGTNTTTFTYPSTGNDGAKGLKVAMTAYTGGDAKWFFNDVTVTPGTAYTYSEAYKATVQTDLVIRYTSTANVVSYADLATLPAAANWTTKTYTITPPAGTKSLTVFHVLSAVGTLETDTFSLVGPGTGGGTDTTKPTVAITVPANNSTATGTVNVTVTAADNVAVANVKLFVDGASASTPATSSPYKFSFDSKLYTNSTHVLTAEATDAAGNAASSSINITFNNPIADTIAPVASVTSPTASSTLSGTTTISVSASDNIGVKEVHILIDDEASVLTSAPYSLTFSTKSFTDGPHTVSAYAVDAAGNIGNASPVAVTINNAPDQTVQNIIPNPMLETANPSDATLPYKWNKGGWGTNDAAYSYPTAGVSNSKAARITITSYTDGDAKWYFDDATVTANAIYDFSDQYKSNVPTVVTARFTYTDNTIQYRDIINLPASANWTTASSKIEIPANVVSMTVFHILNKAGTLDTDNYTLTLATSTPTSNSFNQGMVSLTFDDGWTSQYENARPILNAAGLKGGFYIITNEIANADSVNHRVGNSEFEVGTTLPSNWTKSVSGTNNAVLTYPATGTANSKGVEVKITSYTDGDAKWLFTPATVIDKTEYTYSQMYKATVPTKIYATFTFNDNTSTTTLIDTLPAAADWTAYSKVIKMPSSMKNVVVYNALESTGTLTLDSVYLDQIYIYMTSNELKTLYNEGHEVSAHTRTHAHLPVLTQTQMTDEVVGSRAALQALGISPVDTFLYPYGEYNDQVIQTVKNAGYIGARSVDEGYNMKDTNKYILLIKQADNTTTLSQFKIWVDTAKNNKSWLIVMYHQIEEDGTDSLNIKPSLLKQMTDYIVSQAVPVVTMDQAIAQMNP